MKKKFKLSIVGCGDISNYMGWACRINRNIEVVSCVSPVHEQVTNFSSRFGIPNSCIDYEDVFGMDDLDAVYLAVPHHLHYPMIKLAIEKGVHVFCEKPVTVTLDQGLEICRLSREKKIRVGVNYQNRYEKGCYALASACQKGELGEIYYSRCNLPWHREEKYFDCGEWRSRIETSGGGTLITQGSHLLDIAIWSLGSKPVSAIGITRRQRFKGIEVEDLCMGIVEMENGSLIEITSSMISNRERPVTIEMYGSEASAFYKGFDFSSLKIKGKRIKREKPGVKGIHAFTRSLEGFRRWVVNGEPYLVPVEQSLPVLAAVNAIYRSSETGKKEMVDMSYAEFI